MWILFFFVTCYSAALSLRVLLFIFLSLGFFLEASTWCPFCLICQARVQRSSQGRWHALIAAVTAIAASVAFAAHAGLAAVFAVAAVTSACPVGSVVVVVLFVFACCVVCPLLICLLFSRLFFFVCGCSKCSAAVHGLLLPTAAAFITPCQHLLHFFFPSLLPSFLAVCCGHRSIQL